MCFNVDCVKQLVLNAFFLLNVGWQVRQLDMKITTYRFLCEGAFLSINNFCVLANLVENVIINEEIKWCLLPFFRKE